MRRNLEETREFFKDDLFANRTGIIIEEVDEGYAKCSMPIQDYHRNARRGVHGGAIFSLGDFCFGVAVDGIAVSMTSEINYLAASKGSILYAEAKELKNGKSTVFYEITITDDLGKKIAFLTMTGYKVN